MPSSSPLASTPPSPSSPPSHTLSRQPGTSILGRLGQRMADVHLRATERRSQAVPEQVQPSVQPLVSTVKDPPSTRDGPLRTRTPRLQPRTETFLSDVRPDEVAEEHAQDVETISAEELCSWLAAGNPTQARTPSIGATDAGDQTRSPASHDLRTRIVAGPTSALGVASAEVHGRRHSAPHRHCRPEPGEAAPRSDRSAVAAASAAGPPPPHAGHPHGGSGTSTGLPTQISGPGHSHDPRNTDAGRRRPPLGSITQSLPSGHPDGLGDSGNTRTSSDHPPGHQELNHHHHPHHLDHNHQIRHYDDQAPHSKLQNAIESPGKASRPHSGVSPLESRTRSAVPGVSEVRPVVILDLRPLEAFLTCRIAGSINLALPSLVVRRMKRASAGTSATSISATTSRAGPSASPVAHLTTYMTTSASKRRFEQLLDGLDAGVAVGDAMPSRQSGGKTCRTALDLWRADVVVLAEPARSLATVSAANSRSQPSPAASSSATHPSSTSIKPLPRSPFTANAPPLEAPRALCHALQQLAPPEVRASDRCGRVRLFESNCDASVEPSPLAAMFETGSEDGSEGLDAVAEGSTAAGLQQARSLTRGPTSPSARTAPLPRLAVTSGQPVLPSSPTQGRCADTDDEHFRSAQAGFFAGAGSVTTTSSPPSQKQTTSLSPSRRPGRPSLARIDTSERVKTLGLPGGHGLVPGPAVSLPTSSSSVIPDEAAYAMPKRALTAAASPSSAQMKPPSLSLQTVAHLQAKLLPSPASFRDASVPVSPEGLSGAERMSSASCSPAAALTAAQVDREVARRESVPVVEAASNGVALPPSHRSITHSDAPVFDVSTVVPGFLFLGPDITSREEAAQLKSLGVRRILNCAAEISDKGRRGPTAAAAAADDGAPRLNGARPSSGDPTARLTGEVDDPDGASPESLPLGDVFDRYLKIPMWDNVEARGVAGHFEQACQFLDDARLHDAPVYVHCRAGKSRSVSVVIAYLIHAYKWSLRKAYAYVVERRSDVSPNIGFVSCLMAFEEMTLSQKSQGIIETSSGADHTGDCGEAVDGDFALRHSRQSMPVFPSTGSALPLPPSGMAETASSASPNGPAIKGGPARDEGPSPSGPQKAPSPPRPFEGEGLTRRATVAGLGSLTGAGGP